MNYITKKKFFLTQSIPINCDLKMQDLLHCDVARWDADLVLNLIQVEDVEYVLNTSLLDSIVEDSLCWWPYNYLEIGL